MEEQEQEEQEQEQEKEEQEKEGGGAGNRNAAAATDDDDAPAAVVVSMGVTTEALLRCCDSVRCCCSRSAPSPRGRRNRCARPFPTTTLADGTRRRIGAHRARRSAAIRAAAAVPAKCTACSTRRRAGASPCATTRRRSKQRRSQSSRRWRAAHQWGSPPTQDAVERRLVIEMREDATRWDATVIFPEEDKARFEPSSRWRCGCVGEGHGQHWHARAPGFTVLRWSDTPCTCSPAWKCRWRPFLPVRSLSVLFAPTGGAAAGARYTGEEGEEGRGDGGSGMVLLEACLHCCELAGEQPPERHASAAGRTPPPPPPTRPLHTCRGTLKGAYRPRLPAIHARLHLLVTPRPGRGGLASVRAEGTPQMMRGEMAVDDADALARPPSCSPTRISVAVCRWRSARPWRR